MTTKTALTRFLDTWSALDTAADIAQQLTCDEADSIAAIFEANNRLSAAAAWIEAHSYADEEGDAHWRGTAAE